MITESLLEMDMKISERAMTMSLSQKKTILTARDPHTATSLKKAELTETTKKTKRMSL